MNRLDKLTARRWWKHPLVIIGCSGGVLSLLLLAGGVVAYDRATRADRTYPLAVLESFTREYFAGLDRSGSEIYLCSEPSLEQLDDLRAALVAGDGVELSWRVTIVSTVQKEGGRTIDTELQIRREANGFARNELQRWRFHLVEEGGWRVCGAEQLPRQERSVTPPTVG